MAPGPVHLLLRIVVGCGDWACTCRCHPAPLSRRLSGPRTPHCARAARRAAAENEAYGGLVRRWLEERYTLRYSGALVPDLHHVITRGGGVFCNPTSAGAKPKLRLLYEVAPLAYVTVAAGGAATDEAGPALDKVIAEHGAKGPVCLGGKAEVEACQEAMRSSVV